MNQPPQPPKGNADLYATIVDMHKAAYKKDSWNGAKYKKSTGHMLQQIFGKKVWTLKDLDDYQLLEIGKMCERIISKQEFRKARDAFRESESPAREYGARA